MPTAPDRDHLLPLPPTEVWLMPERAVFEPASGTLFVADVHLGKAAVFRARGVPVPSGTSRETLARLSVAIARTGATRLVVLGDFLHAKESQSAGTLAELAAWRTRHPALDAVVVEGNHDRHAGRVQADYGFRPLDGPWRGGALCGVHDVVKADDPAAWTLAGHVHPVVTLRGRHDTLRLPCFWLRGRMLTLPAFGAFTGGYAPTFEEDDRAFVVGDAVWPLNPASRPPLR